MTAVKMAGLLVEHTDPMLHRPARPVVTFDESLVDLVAGMFTELYRHHAFALAAPQIGVPYAVAAIERDPRYPELKEPLTLINPVVTVDAETQFMWREGCLSYPGLFWLAPRPDKVVVSYQDVHGEAQTLLAEGLLGRVIQHEVDHLRGVTIADLLRDLANRGNRQRRNGIKRELAKWGVEL